MEGAGRLGRRHRVARAGAAPVDRESDEARAAVSHGAAIRSCAENQSGIAARSRSRSRRRWRARSYGPSSPITASACSTSDSASASAGQTGSAGSYSSPAVVGERGQDPC